MAQIGQLRTVALDCPDPRALADFYRQLVGGEITYADDEWVNLRDGANVLLSFQRAENYTPPDWPTGPRGQQAHIDVTVRDVDEAERQLLALGATSVDTRLEHETDDNWRVYLDPAGHPFCLVWDH